MVNIFPKDITPWSGQDSNPGPSASYPDALYTRPHRPPVYTFVEIVSSNLIGHISYNETKVGLTSQQSAAQIYPSPCAIPNHKSKISLSLRITLTLT